MNTTKHQKLVVDEALDFQGNATIRLDDGTPNGNTEENPVATVYGNTSYAELFAAAPELLEALKEMVKVCEEEEMAMGDGNAYPNAVAAIKKAEGKS